MGRSFLHLFVFLLALSSSIIVLSARTQVLVQSPNKMISEDTALEEALINGRMDLERSDYPPSSANGHHTPPNPPR
ncbi:hypothetical protein IHE45_05G194800 [Dioscorea alata]|uniref:Uncharacterized protein n=1 Tax=Dioscorea alata TaxID=55571 RepID=A0ACB7W7K3_DIOAL|nr:hypothetical protein IHE45_05G194800 [Dioscorea alata]